MQLDDVSFLLEEWTSLATRRGWHIVILGMIDKDPLLFITTGLGEEGKLIAAGFHGEEPAGPWGLLRAAKNSENEGLFRQPVAFLPLVNPTGLRRLSRYNHRGQNPNCGFSAAEESNLSDEGKLLLKFNKDIVKASSHGFLSLHEDCDSAAAYLYTFENSERPSQFSLRLRSALADHHDMLGTDQIYGDPVDDSIIFNLHDASFEDHLFSSGISCAACTETPGLDPIDVRLSAVESVVRTFLSP